MKSILALVLLLSLTACGKGIGSGGATDIGVPESTVNKDLKFSNYGTTISTVIRMTGSSRVELPQSGIKVSYQSAPSKSDLTVLLNGAPVCNYKWTLGQFLAQSGCSASVQVESGDEFTVSGIPINQNVTITVQIPK